jgi:hypothetical protein
MRYHPLTPFNLTIKDYSIFKAHLRLPLPWLKVIFRNFRDLTPVPGRLGELTAGLNEFLRNQMSNETPMTMKEKLYLIAGIPAVYIRRHEPPVAKADPFRAYSTILRQIRKFTEQGHVLFFHSSFQDQALLAACNIAKSAVDFKISSFVIDVPSFIDATKEFESNSKSDAERKAEESELLVLWSVGAEYRTPWSDSQLDPLISKRVINKQTTILVSSLTPKDYAKRYEKELVGTILQFEDSNMTLTLNQLIKELED